MSQFVLTNKEKGIIFAAKIKKNEQQNLYHDQAGCY